MSDRPKQAYRQAPWRLQIQWVGAAVLVIIVVLTVLGIYLNISGQAAEAGMNYQFLQYKKDELVRSIATQKSVLGELLSAANMETRALGIGFHHASPDEIVYVEVPNYPGRQAALLAPLPGPIPLPDQIVKPAYRQSLWEWFFQGIYQYSANPGGTGK